MMEHSTHHFKTLVYGTWGEEPKRKEWADIMTELPGEQQQHRLGNYKLIRLLGTGQYTIVYLGEHIHLKSQAAVKMFQAHMVEDERISRLAGLRRAAALRHPHIARVLEFGDDGGRQFLVSEYAMHGPLRLGAGEQLPLSTVVAYVDAIAAALQYAHKRGLVHGAIKPENILLGQGERVLLTDFRAWPYPAAGNDSDELVTLQHGEAAIYLAPEQWHGRSSPASDQYALAIVIYEWLRGTPPFQGSLTDLHESHCHAVPPVLPEVAVQAFREVERVLQKALAKDEQQRFTDIHTFAQAFAQAAGKDIASGKDATLRLSSQPGTLEPLKPMLTTLPATEKKTLTERHGTQIPARRLRKRMLTVVLSCILTALLLVGSGLLIFQREVARPPQAEMALAREATMSAMSTQELYTFVTGSQPLISDKLDRSQGSHWSGEQENQGKGSCAFQSEGGTIAYHIIVQVHAPAVACLARSSNFSNFAFQVTMLDILQNYADNGGIAFCGNQAGNTFNFFSVSDSGYSLVHYQAGRESLLKGGLLPISVNTDIDGQQLTMIAYNGHYFFYMDGYFIVKQDMARACAGAIGFFVEHADITKNTVSNYAFSDARIWQL
jgi:hypothetical protein